MPEEGRIRLDKWLWQARFFKSRSLSAGMVESGHLRINGVKTHKPAHAVGPSDVLTFAHGGQIRVICILACGQRRGPATEAQQLYRDTSGNGDTVPATSGQME